MMLRSLNRLLHYPKCSWLHRRTNIFISWCCAPLYWCHLNPSILPRTRHKVRNADPVVSRVLSDVCWILGIAKDDRLYGSFVRPYVGEAVDGFFDYLTSNNKKFSESSRPYYGKFCSIVQSSGTGKSRLLTEVRIISVFVHSVAQYVNLAPEQRRHCPVHEHS